jgi:hypothetical protein
LIDLAEVQRRILATLSELPSDVREPPATLEQLEQFERAFGEVAHQYRWFLLNWGGGAVGREWLDGISKLAASQTKYQEEFGPPSGWSMERVFIIGWDGFGNPIAIHKPTGRVLLENHNFGGVHELASSFFEYAQNLLYLST